MPGGSSQLDSIRHEVVVPGPPERAFEKFTAGLWEWWPSEFTWSQDLLEEIGVEPKDGGACFEIGPNGFRCDWGRVMSWEPPHRVKLSWQIGPDRVPEPNPAKASEVLVEIDAANGQGSRVVVEHSGFERHGSDGDAYRAGMDRGWSYLIDRYAAVVRNS